MDNMTEMDLSAKKLKQTVLTEIKRDLNPKIDNYRQRLNQDYLKTKIFLNYLPVMISIIFLIFNIYYLVIGIH